MRESENGDVALLRVSGGLDPATWCDADEDQNWIVKTPPRPDSPYLSGRVDVASRTWEDYAGRLLHIMQLSVEQSLGAYFGYSGSGVLLPSRDNGVAGILIEQQPKHVRQLSALNKRFTNVLYAVPVRAALDFFDIPHSHTQQPAANTAQDLQLKEVRFLASYLSRVVEQLDFIELPGLDLDPRRTRYSLTSSFAPLEILQSGMPIDAHGLLEPGSSSLITGEPGSGKSTLVKYLAIHAAQQSLNESNLAELRIPILVKLRREGQSLHKETLGGKLTDLPAKASKEWIPDLLNNGRAIVCFDGLDEIPELERESVTRWISAFVDEYCARGTTVIVTSRDYAVSEARCRPEVEIEAAIQPLDANRTLALVTSWHTTIAELDELENDGLSDAHRLIAQLDASPELAMLASNPLMCAVMCVLFHRRWKAFPSHRLQFYRSLVSMLVGQRNLDREESGKYGVDSLERLVEQVAAQFLDAELVEAPYDSVFEMVTLAKAGAAEESVREAKASDLITHLAQRSGVMRRLHDGSIDFWHRSLAEFLCARFHVNDGNDALIASHVSDEGWREVTVWAAAQLTVKRLEDLVLGVLSKAEDEPDETARRSLRLLSARCLSSALAFDLTLDEMVNEAVKDLFPPRNQLEVRELTTMGRAAIPYLDAHLRNLDDPAAALACLSVAARIGGDACHTMLANLPLPAKVAWEQQLIEAWSVRAQGDYGMRVLGSLPAEGPNRLVRVTSARQLSALPDLPRRLLLEADLVRSETTWLKPSHRLMLRLRLREWESSAIWSLLDDFPNVEHLAITSPGGGFDPPHGPVAALKVRTIALVGDNGAPARLSAGAVIQFRALEAVRLTQASVLGDVGVLSRLRLERVYVDDGDLSWLNAIEQVAQLEIEWFSEVDLSSLSEIRGVERLYIRNAPHLESLVGVEQLSSLRYLELGGSSQVEDWELLHECRDLEWVHVGARYSASERLPFETRDFALLPHDRDDLPGARGVDLRLGEVWSRYDRDMVDVLSVDEIEMRNWDDPELLFEREDLDDLSPAPRDGSGRWISSHALGLAADVEFWGTAIENQQAGDAVPNSLAASASTSPPSRSALGRSTGIESEILAFELWWDPTRGDKRGYIQRIFATDEASYNRALQFVNLQRAERWHDPDLVPITLWPEVYDDDRDRYRV